MKLYRSISFFCCCLLHRCCCLLFLIVFFLLVGFLVAYACVMCSVDVLTIWQSVCHSIGFSLSLSLYYIHAIWYAYKSSSICAAWKHRHMTRSRGDTQTEGAKMVGKRRGKIAGSIVGLKILCRSTKSKIVENYITNIMSSLHKISCFVSFGESQPATTNLPPPYTM